MKFDGIGKWYMSAIIFVVLSFAACKEDPVPSESKTKKISYWDSIKAPMSVIPKITPKAAKPIKEATSYKKGILAEVASNKGLIEFNPLKIELKAEYFKESCRNSLKKGTHLGIPISSIKDFKCVAGKENEIYYENLLLVKDVKLAPSVQIGNGCTISIDETEDSAIYISGFNCENGEIKYNGLWLKYLSTNHRWGKGVDRVHLSRSQKIGGITFPASTSISKFGMLFKIHLGSGENLVLNRYGQIVLTDEERLIAWLDSVRPECKAKGYGKADKCRLGTQAVVKEDLKFDNLIINSGTKLIYPNTSYGGKLLVDKQVLVKGKDDLYVSKACMLILAWKQSVHFSKSIRPQCIGDGYFEITESNWDKWIRGVSMEYSDFAKIPIAPVELTLSPEIEKLSPTDKKKRRKCIAKNNLEITEQKLKMFDSREQKPVVPRVNMKNSDEAMSTWSKYQDRRIPITTRIRDLKNIVDGLSDVVISSSECNLFSEQKSNITFDKDSPLGENHTINDRKKRKKCSTLAKLKVAESQLTNFDEKKKAPPVPQLEMKNFGNVMGVWSEYHDRRISISSSISVFNDILKDLSDVVITGSECNLKTVEISKPILKKVTKLGEKINTKIGCFELKGSWEEFSSNCYLPHRTRARLLEASLLRYTNDYECIKNNIINYTGDYLTKICLPKIRKSDTFSISNDSVFRKIVHLKKSVSGKNVDLPAKSKVKFFGKSFVEIQSPTDVKFKNYLLKKNSPIYLWPDGQVKGGRLAEKVKLKGVLLPKGCFVLWDNRGELKYAFDTGPNGTARILVGKSIPRLNKLNIDKSFYRIDSFGEDSFVIDQSASIGVKAPLVVSLITKNGPIWSFLSEESYAGNDSCGSGNFFYNKAKYTTIEKIEGEKFIVVEGLLNKGAYEEYDYRKGKVNKSLERGFHVISTSPYIGLRMHVLGKKINYPGKSRFKIKGVVTLPQTLYQFLM